MCVPQDISLFMRCVVRWALLVTICLIIPPPTAAAPKFTDYKEMGVQYDEYPVVVPKRAAMLLDRIMVALQKAVDEDTVKSAKNRIPIEDTMDLQRRGQQKGGRIYWRCYFNAVTCF
uniref:Allatostatin CC n=1 Tax=Plautia stali TaxID=106108 RepID=A0A1I9GEV8_PLAST|nr:allatostatin CC [Plautia stali]